MARIHNLGDTEDKELRNEYLLANAKVKDWFYFSTGCSNHYSLQQATFVLVNKLRNSIEKFYTVTNIFDEIFYEGNDCYGWALEQPATFLTDLLLDYPVVAFDCEDDDGSIRIERFRLEDRGEFYEVS